MLRVAFFAVVIFAVGCQRPSPALTPVTARELKQAIQAVNQPVVVVNMWATWCGPCREEFPDLVQLQRQYADRGVRVLFVSWDMEPATAQQFLAAQGVDYPTFIKSDAEGDQQFIAALAPQWTGAFPATMIYDRTGTLRDFWEGKRKFADFASAVQTVLQSTQPKGKPQ